MSRQRRLWLVATILGLIALATATIWFLVSFGGVAVLIENRTGEELRDVKLVTTARSRSIDRIEPGRTARIRVAREEIERVEVRYRLADGSRMSAMTEREVTEVGPWPYRELAFSLRRNGSALGMQDSWLRQMVNRVRRQLGF